MRLTQGDRDAIVRKVIEAIIGPRRAKHLKAEQALASKVLNAALGKHRRAYLGMSREFQYWNNYVGVNAGGLRFSLHFAKEQPTARGELTLTGDLAEEVRRHIDADKQLRTDERELSSQIWSVIGAASSAKQLRELWPDGAKCYDKVLAGTPKLPVSVQALQKKIEECRA